MPLKINAHDCIKNNLLSIAKGKNVVFRVIGCLTSIQFHETNRIRSFYGLKPLECNEVTFLGRHIYERRHFHDGYEISDIVTQITHCLENSSTIISIGKRINIESSSLRRDKWGNIIKDRGVFRFKSAKPRVELYSVIPRGDFMKCR